MNTSWFQQRKTELEDLRFTDPVQLIVMYRVLTGLDDREPLPTGASYASIIQAILEHETAKLEGEEAPQDLKENTVRPSYTLNDSTITLIEHMRTSKVAQPHGNRNEPAKSFDALVTDELFGPIDIYDERIDWLAAARFANAVAMPQCP